ncbi:hypothetical protein Aperf_G00000031822 [Anoplocephala perfoliata]
MLFQAYFFFFISIGHAFAPSPDVVSALADINQAIAAGRQLARELTSYVSTEETRLTKLRQLVHRLYNALEINTASEEGQLTSLVTEETTDIPVSAFLNLLILRLASNWSSELSALLEVKYAQIGNAEALIETLMELDPRSGLFLRLKTYAAVLPDDNDVRGALDTVIRLQQTYNIPSIAIAEGKILPSPSSALLANYGCESSRKIPF